MGDVIRTRRKKEEPEHGKLQAVVMDRDDGTRELLINGHPLLGAAELADALGVRVQNLQFIKDIPEAVSRPRATRIWLGHEIHEFAQHRKRVKQAA